MTRPLSPGDAEQVSAWTYVAKEGVFIARRGGLEVGLNDDYSGIWVHDTASEWPNGCFVPNEVVDRLRRANNILNTADPSKAAEYLSELEVEENQNAE